MTSKGIEGQAQLDSVCSNEKGASATGPSFHHLWRGMYSASPLRDLQSCCGQGLQKQWPKKKKKGVAKYSPTKTLSFTLHRVLSIAEYVNDWAIEYFSRGSHSYHLIPKGLIAFSGFYQLKLTRTLRFLFRLLSRALFLSSFTICLHENENVQTKRRRLGCQHWKPCYFSARLSVLR